MLGGEGVNDENELLEPLATEAGQQAIARAINNLSSLEYAVRAERAATNAAQSADEALNSATAASSSEEMARKWATKTDGAVAQETIEIPPEQEGDDPTTETINLYSARYYAALAEETYNNMQFDSEPTENSTKLLSSGTIYTALYGKADKSTTYTKTEVDTQISTAVSNLVNSAPSTLDTLEELADALGDDPNFATTIATQLGNKADKSDTYTKTEVDTALSNVQSTLTFDNVPTANSDNPVKSSGIKTALDGKQDTLTFDSTPTANSTNPVTSGGVYTALQNVNIDIDDEITEDSDNPVTSAAIYEALQNFTPSGGGGLATFPSINTNNLIYTIYDNMSSWAYDVDVTYIATENCFIVGGINTNFNSTPSKNTGVGIFVNDVLIQQINHSATEHSSGAGVLVPLSKGDKIRMKTLSGSIKAYLYVYGVKNNELLLSEQMYSNVLYENSSGWSSGSITLNDSLENYDFIEFIYNNPNDTGYYLNRILSSNEMVNGAGKYSMSGWGNRVFNFQIDSPTSLTFLNRDSYVVYKIVGYKMAKGGYSGIVSDTRMTVKSGVYEYTTTTGTGLKTISITFDSPMPDANYIVLTSPATSCYNYTRVFPYIKQEEKTASGFTLGLYCDASAGSGDNLYKISWIAIRPNSYTREGMVEDVLFSNASGVSSGTINLSGNISDYDLIDLKIVYSGGGANQVGNHQILSSMLISCTGTSSNLANVLLLSLVSGYLRIGYVNDNTLNIILSNGGIKIVQVTGIKFGRYVSGVAVDNTITSSGTGVPSTNAVYQALQNIPSGGGGGGSISGDVYRLSTVSLNADFTLDDSSYSNNTNISPEKIWRGTAGSADRCIYKKNAIHSICCTANVNSYAYGVVLSLQEIGVILQHTSYNGDTVNEEFQSMGRIYDSNNGIYWYYCGANAAGVSFDRATSEKPKITGTYTSVVEAAQALLSLANPVVIQIPVKEDLFNPTDYVVTSGSTTSDNTLRSLIYGYRPIKINGETYYFVKLDNGTYYYENPDNTITIDSSWVITITAKNSGGSSITVDSSITQGSTNPVEGGAIYTALGDKADQSTTYTKTQVDTALSSKGDVTTNTDQNITGTKTFVGSKKIAFKQSATNDKLGFTLFGNTGTERGYLEFNPTNTVDGVTGLMTLGNYATSAAALTQVGFRRYSNISGASGAYNLLMPMVADARTPFSLTTTYQNFYLPLGFTDGTTTVRTAKSGLVDLSPLLTAAINSITNANGVSY